MPETSIGVRHALPGSRLHLTVSSIAIPIDPVWSSNFKLSLLLPLGILQCAPRHRRQASLDAHQAFRLTMYFSAQGIPSATTCLLADCFVLSKGNIKCLPTPTLAFISTVGIVFYQQSTVVSLSEICKGTAPCCDSVDDEASSERHKDRMCEDTPVSKYTRIKGVAEPRLLLNLSGTDTLFSHISDVNRDMIDRRFWAIHCEFCYLGQLHVRSRSSSRRPSPKQSQVDQQGLGVLSSASLRPKQAMGIYAAPVAQLYQDVVEDDSTCGPERNVFRYAVCLAQNTAQGVDPVQVTSGKVREWVLAPRWKAEVEGGKVLIVRSDTLPPLNILGFCPIAVAGRDHHGSTWLAGGK
ncbi:uncharacterized protein BO96DRAFT_428592 [Aspergillus niger CBS 101883]|uniref:uncharacterized protein n=1 Tax=Aspergillus lacticoffeatus (strain CBS 101883) TaxID=1450533 RepID=UPI000D7FC1EE|nr:uncharacterized protein BO96DRAFT_428592 [Aspergillus niger CBS 101883]PYH61824.1 hypothetical protein BO96DRAFT_428592 [Aspergillus niger CBS 101883]